jgi:putative sterol carrier protein
MPVKYLSPEWIDAYNATVAADDSVRQALNADNAEVTIRQSYETSAQVNRGELDGAKAFTQGKVKITGKMMKMMQLRGPLAEVQKALDSIDTEY